MTYNFITVCVGPAYGPEYPNMILRMIERHFKEPFQMYCVTDKTVGLNEKIRILRPTHDLKGWWNKLYMFSPLMPEGRLIYLDLDVVLVGDITEMVTSYNGDYCGDEDHIHWGSTTFTEQNLTTGKIDCALGTAFVSMRAGAHPEVWEDYLFNREWVEKTFEVYGDQVYTSLALHGKFDLWERLFPETHGIGSYKFDYLGQMPKHVYERINKRVHGPRPIEEFKLVNFHGRPKPLDVMDQHDWLKAALC